MYDILQLCIKNVWVCVRAYECMYTSVCAFVRVRASVCDCVSARMRAHYTSCSPSGFLENDTSRPCAGRAAGIRHEGARGMP